MLRVHLNGTHVREAAVSKGLEKVTSYIMPPPTDKSPQRVLQGTISLIFKIPFLVFD